jgi:hypothetical protein
MDDDDQVRSELLAIQAASPDGLLHTEEALQWAQDHPHSALHRRLEWNNARAGHAWRMHQMRAIIRLHVVSETGEPELINLSIDRTNGGGYRDRSQVERDRSLMEVVERDAWRELTHLREKYRRLKRFEKVWRAIDALKPGFSTASASASASQPERRPPGRPRKHPPQQPGAAA